MREATVDCRDRTDAANSICRAIGLLMPEVWSGDQIRLVLPTWAGPSGRNQQEAKKGERYRRWLRNGYECQAWVCSNPVDREVIVRIRDVESVIARRNLLRRNGVSYRVLVIIGGRLKAAVSRD